MMLHTLFQLAISRAIDRGRPAPRLLRHLMRRWTGLARYDQSTRHVDTLLTDQARDLRRDLGLTSTPRPSPQAPPHAVLGRLGFWSGVAAVLILGVLLWTRIASTPQTAHTPALALAALTADWDQIARDTETLQTAVTEQATHAARLPGRLLNLDQTVGDWTRRTTLAARTEADAWAAGLRSTFPDLPGLPGPGDILPPAPAPAPKTPTS